MTEARYVVYDVDDVLLDMDALAGPAQAAVGEAMRRFYDAATADRVRAAVARGYATLRADLRAGASEEAGAYPALFARLERWQRGVTDAGYEIKRWSRQGLVALALEDLGLQVRADPVHAGAEAYWDTLARGTRLLPDAARSIARARAGGAVVHFATNSDGWLRFDEAAQTFRYDPEAAAAKKRERLQVILHDGLGPRDLTVGDPVGKPHAGFYEAVLADIEAKTGAPVDPTRLLPIGDSLSNDVLPFVTLGAPRGVWILRRGEGATPRPVPGAELVTEVRTLDELAALGFGA